MNARSLCVVALAVLTSAAAAQSTAFTYQGRLKNGAALAAGLHDFRFRLFDAASGGAQIGSIQCVDNILVSEGVFAATIDFGQQYATTAARFLEIEVRADTGLTCASATGFIVLGPRQLLTSAPLASHAKSAFSLDAADGSPANAVIVDNSGNVGIGTTTPTHTVHVAAPGPALALQDNDGNATQVGYVSLRNTDNTETGWMGFGDPGNQHFGIVNARSGGNIFLLPFTGNVGIGTTAPAAKLDVRGDIRLGNGNQFFAAAGDENVRIIRGKVSGNGNPIAGSGFSSVRASVGQYTITFTTPFNGVPIMVGSPDVILPSQLGLYRLG